MSDRIVISQSTLDEVARVSREWPDGIHTCAELQRREPGRRPCTCGRCPDPEPIKDQAARIVSDYRRAAGAMSELARLGAEAVEVLERIAGES